MCGIVGFFNIACRSLCNIKKCNHILNNINIAKKQKVLDKEKFFIYKNCGLKSFGFNSKNINQHMSKKFNSKFYTIIYDGDIYNSFELRRKLIKKGAVFHTQLDVEVILNGHLIFGEKFFRKLNGIFSYAILDRINFELTIFRDEFGVKPLFYMIYEGILIFSSKVEILFQYLLFEKNIYINKFFEISKVPYKKKFNEFAYKSIFEVYPGHYLKVSKKFIKHKKI